MKQSFSKLYPTLAGLAERGVCLEVNAGGGHLEIASLYDEEQMVCQFVCGGMSADAIFDRLEELAVRFETEGIATDDVNGEEASVW